MIYLKREREVFEETKLEFAKACAVVIGKMWTICEDRGRIRDMNSPLHHRKSPQGMLAVADGKCYRLERLLTMEEPDIEQIIEECVDIANYVVFIGALYYMIQQEKTNVTSEHSTPSVGGDVSSEEVSDEPGTLDTESSPVRRLTWTLPGTSDAGQRSL